MAMVGGIYGTGSDDFLSGDLVVEIGERNDQGVKDSGAKTSVLGSEGVKLDFSRSWASFEDTDVFVKFGSLLGRRWDSRVGGETRAKWKLLFPLLDSRARL
ncbi:hypothetical protein U1Q18_006828 [Sarracenia purpurea var. burkii]